MHLFDPIQPDVIFMHVIVQDAKAELHAVLAQDPSSSHAWHTLGQMAEETGDLTQAVHCFSQGLRSSGLCLHAPYNPCLPILFRHLRVMTHSVLYAKRH